MNCRNSTGPSEAASKFHRNPGMSRRTWLAAAAATPLLSGCFWPRFFDLSWDEEVQLHDGRVIVVKLKYTYERLGASFKRYIPSILRATEISFDAGEPIGRFTQVFQKHRVVVFERLNNKWYFLLETRGAPQILKTDAGYQEEWGSSENSSGHKCWSLGEGGLMRAFINELSDDALKVNILMDYANAEELAEFGGTRVTLARKALYAQKYPLDPPHMRIQRPQLVLHPSK